MVQYGAETNAEDIAKQYDLTGKVALVTGGYAGIGRETSRVLALAGAQVFVVGRDLPKATKAVEELKTETGKQHIIADEVDLSSFASIRKFAEKFNQRNLPLQLLILNAGVMATPQGKTADGFETQFGTNFLGHFLLTNLLLPSLLRGVPSRVVSVSSGGHCISGIIWDDYNFEKHPYNKWEAYGQSKSGNILFANEFNKRYKSQGITASSLHPGVIYTELSRHISRDEVSPEAFAKIPNIAKGAKFNVKPKTVGQGAATTIYAALAPEAAEGGKFYDDCRETDAIDHATDPENAARAWDLAAKLTGL